MDVSDRPAEERPWDAQSQQSEAVADGGVIILNKRRRNLLAMINDASFSLYHAKICLVAGIGFFTDAYDIFAINIAVAMLGIVYGDIPGSQTSPRKFSPWKEAGLKVATPAGSLVGQLLFGWLADILGRKRMYGIELVIMIIATFGQVFSGGGPYMSIITALIFWRVILGIGVGGDYPLSAIITSESASTRTRGRLMTAVFAFQGLGQLVASLFGLVLVAAYSDHISTSTNKVDQIWRILIGFGCVPAAIGLYFRLTVPETFRFTMDIERRIEQATRDIENAVANNTYPDRDNESIIESCVLAPRASTADFIAHFSKWKNSKILFSTAYSWFALDIVFYLLSLNPSLVLSGIHFHHPIASSGPYWPLFDICLGNLALTLAGYIPGFFVTFFLIDIWGRKPIQLTGFIVLTILFFVVGFGFNLLVNPNTGIANHALVGIFCLANFFQNFGPNTTTFIIPGEVFPTRYRSTAYGISAACGKLGAVVAQFLLAITEGSEGRLQKAFKALAFVMLTGVFSTLLIPETKQQTLEHLSNEDQEEFIMTTRSSTTLQT